MTLMKDSYQKPTLPDVDPDKMSHSETPDADQNPLRARKDSEEASGIHTDTTRFATPDRPNHVVDEIESANHVTQPKEKDVVKIYSSPKAIARHIVKGGGSSRYRISPDKLENLIKNVPPRMKRLLYALRDEYSKSLKDFTTFNLEIISEYSKRREFDAPYGHDLYAYYQILELTRAKKGICECEQLLKELKETETYLTDRIQKREDFPAAVHARTLADVIHQLESKQATRNAVMLQTSPNPNEIESLTRKISILEQRKDTLTRQLNEQQEREATSEQDYLAVVETQAQYRETRNRVISLLSTFKLVAGSRITSTTKTSGVLTYVKDDFDSLYDAYLRDIISRILTIEEIEEHIVQYPNDYVAKILKLFDNEKLHNHAIKRIDPDTLDHNITKWNASDVVATFKVTPQKTAASIQGYALFCSGHSYVAMLGQISRHFDHLHEVQFNIVLYDFNEDRICASASDKGYALITYSFVSSGPRRFAPSPVGDSEFTVLSQTKAVCRYCRQPGHNIKNCSKKCQRYGQSHHGRNTCR